LASALSRLGRAEEAVEALESIQGMPVSTVDRPWVLATSAEILLAAGRPRDALVALDDYLAKVHGEAEVVAGLINRARAQLDLGNADAAAADCRRAISLRPNSPDAYALLGGAEEARGNPGEALEAYRRYRAQGGSADEVTRAIERLESTHPDP
jgi:predicted Zn-dependent protease